MKYDKDLKGFAMKILLLSLVIFTTYWPGVYGRSESSERDTKVADLLEKMTIEEKVGQMTQISLQVVSEVKGTAKQKHKIDDVRLREAITKYHVGSIFNVYDIAMTVEEWHSLISKIQDLATQETRLRIPVIYGIDAIHGANYTYEATLFPQSLAMAATRNPDLVKKTAKITAYEMRACGIPWNFNPVLGVGRNPLWPRLFETFGEDPFLVSILGEAYIKGLEGEHNEIGAHDKVAGCMKHYVGYSYPLTGKDRTPAWIPERMMRDYFLPPFKTAVDAGVHTVMVNSSEINGIPVHSDYHLLTEVLRHELGFKGVVVSDWEDIKRLYDRDRVAGSPEEAVKMAVMAGVDMSMVPLDFSFYDHLLKLVNEGEVPEARIDEAVSRILHVKSKLGLFENPYPNSELKEKVGSDEFAQVSLQAAREALTLLKNKNSLLPLSKEMKVLVTGPTANMRSVLNGGWTYTWQGDVEEFYPKDKKTILEAVQAKIGAENVIYSEGVTFDTTVNISETVKAAKQADVAILCIGEPAYCETPGNIHDLTLSQPQLQLVSAIQSTGTPVVLVLVQGRPRIITSVVKDTPAVLMAYLPGPEGGRAIADVLFGDFNPCGKLPITYPRAPNDLVNYDRKPIEEDDPSKRNPLFDFGHGLSYTTFEYSDIKLDKKAIHIGDSLKVQVAVENTGNKPGKEVVELYLRDLVASVSPAMRRLKDFKGVMLKPGQSAVVTFILNNDDFSFTGRDNKAIIEPGEFAVTIGGLQDSFLLEPITFGKANAR